MREVVRGDKHNLRKSENRNAQISVIHSAKHGQRGALRVQRKIWVAADFQNFLARPNTRRPRKKEVGKRRASIYRARGSPSDAVDHFLVSHVITGIVVIEVVISKNRRLRAISTSLNAYGHLLVTVRQAFLQLQVQGT